MWSCTPTVDIRGNLPDPDQVAQIKIGETSQEKVVELIGSPSSTLTYGDETWNYVYEKTETVSFLTPTVLDYSSLILTFDNTGKVKDIRKVNKNQMKDVSAVGRETPTAGREMSVIEQLVSNVGKFSKDSKVSK